MNKLLTTLNVWLFLHILDTFSRKDHRKTCSKVKSPQDIAHACFVVFHSSCLHYGRWDMFRTVSESYTHTFVQSSIFRSGFLLTKFHFPNAETPNKTKSLEIFLRRFPFFPFFSWRFQNASDVARHGAALSLQHSSQAGHGGGHSIQTEFTLWPRQPVPTRSLQDCSLWWERNFIIGPVGPSVLSQRERVCVSPTLPGCPPPTAHRPPTLQ